MMGKPAGTGALAGNKKSRKPAREEVEKLAAALRCDPCRRITYTDHAGNACAVPVNTAPVVVTPGNGGANLSTGLI